MSLEALVSEPFELLLEMERRAKAAVASDQQAESEEDAWTGIAFRIGDERFVAARGDVREIMPVPEQLTRVPGAKTWLKGIANVRGQLLTVVDLLGFLGSGNTRVDRRTRVLHLATRDVPTAVVVSEVFGFRRFAISDFSQEPADTAIRCERYLSGTYRRSGESWPLFKFSKLVEDDQFLQAGEQVAA